LRDISSEPGQRYQSYFLADVLLSVPATLVEGIHNAGSLPLDLHRCCVHRARGGGQARNISLDNVEKIALALGARVHELLMP